jgi:hypothetical protein
MVGMVTISSNNKNELVAKDYYAQELKYQDRINAIDNEKRLAKSIDVSIQEKNILISFPGETAKDFSGEIIFFRPSDASKDVMIKMAFDKSGAQLISKNILAKGVYKLCLSWKSGNKNYYKEQVINI